MKGAGLAVALAALAGCGKESAPAASGTVSGAVTGTAWNRLASAFWIGKASAPPPVAFLFLLESPTSCAALVHANWDKFIGNEQVLEIELRDTSARGFRVPGEASAAYLRGEYNPDADGGSVTVSEVTPGQSLAGSFDLTFAGDALRGSFQAGYCPDGVEP